MANFDSISRMSSVELCAGAGGQALGLEAAGFEHLALFENDPHACSTLRKNRPFWRVEEHNLFEEFNFSQFKGIDLLAGGLPCPPFSIAGKQLGESDERNLFNIGINIVDEVRPRAVMFENVRGMLGRQFEEYREWIAARLNKMGYKSDWKLLNACDFGVPQLRPRAILVAIKKDIGNRFDWPLPTGATKTVSVALADLMNENDWQGISDWSAKANKIAPTLVGGSKKHGGPDLGPTRARKAWAELGVNGSSLAEHAPEKNFCGAPRLTVKMAATIQGFPDSWEIVGKKTQAYRQVGNAFPPPVAYAVGLEIQKALGISNSMPLKLNGQFE